MLVMFPPIFVTDTKIIYGYNFVVPLTILTVKNCVFYSVQYKNGCFAAPDFFHMFTQSIKFYTFHYHVLKSTDT